MFFFNLLFCFLLIAAFSFSSMEGCLQNPNCSKEVEAYEKKLTIVVIAWYPDLLKEINVVPNLIISDDTTSFHFSANAVDHLIRNITPGCKSNIKPLNRFPFFYAYQGEAEDQVNMNCFFVDYQQYKNLEKCISPEYFNIYSKNRNIQVYWTERVCKKIIGIKNKCKDEQRSRIDIVQDRIICFKQTNKVYDSYVEIAQMDLMSQNGGKTINNLLLELPAEGSDFLNTCIPNCESCFSYEKCNQCQPQYSLVNNKCIKCDYGFYLNRDTLQCQPCSLNCLDCNNNQTCITCVSGFTIQNKECIYDQDRALKVDIFIEEHTLIIVTFLIFILIIVIIIIVIFLKCRNKTPIPQISNTIQTNNVELQQQLYQQQSNDSENIADTHIPETQSIIQSQNSLIVQDLSSNSIEVRYYQGGPIH